MTDARSPLAPRSLRGKILTPRTGSGSRAPSIDYLDDGVVTVGADGRITDVRAWSARASGSTSVPVLDLRPAVLVPGFVDAHVHFPQTRIIGSATGPLLRWLEATVFPEEARFRDEAYARAVAREFIGRMLAVGTTTALCFSSSSPSATDVLFDELDRSGMRAVAGLTLMDQSCPDAVRVPREIAIPACEALASKWHGHDAGRLGFAVTPRFALSCSRALMEDAARVANDRGLLVQTHVAENEREGEETLAAHPWASSYLDVYDRTGLLSDRTVLAHAIHLSHAEWDTLAARGGRVAHCPDSNFFLGSGRMPLDEPRRRAISVGLGSDVAAGRSFDMRRAIAYAYDNALCAGVETTPEELFAMATLGGAAVLHEADVIGSLEPGKDADLAVIDLPDYATSRAEVLALVAFGSEGARVSRVFVRGRSVFSA
jgi:guanine deaminase